MDDHRLDYAGFEGVITRGIYRAGAELDWDRRTCERGGDAMAVLAAGSFGFQLHGKKLMDAWWLVRMKTKPNARRTSWLLIKGLNVGARPRGASDFLVEQPLSVISGRAIEEITPGNERLKFLG
ncbi:hypothetical protein MKL20_19025 [Methylobacterium sp. E-066]|nr:hypothetical protein [Methylobacterium sp. E-066]